MQDFEVKCPRPVSALFYPAIQCTCPAGLPYSTIYRAFWVLWWLLPSVRECNLWLWCLPLGVWLTLPALCILWLAWSCRSLVATSFSFFGPFFVLFLGIDLDFPWSPEPWREGCFFFFCWSRHVLEFGDFLLHFTSNHVLYGLFVWLGFHSIHSVCFATFLACFKVPATCLEILILRHSK